MESNLLNKLVVTLLLLVFTICAFSQELVEMKVAYKNGEIEIFHVLKTDSTIMHGNYQKYFDKKRICIDGSFNMGKKDSTWTTYFSFNKLIQTQGNYKEDKRVGEWSFYNDKGELEQKYNFSKNEISYFKNEFSDTAYKTRIYQNNDTIDAHIERPPLYIGGNYQLFKQIRNNMKYPTFAKEQDIQGRVILVFIINENGKATNISILKGVHPTLDKESLRIIESIKDNWVPAINNGKKVASQMILPLTFTIQ